MSGFILYDKPEGLTSHDVVNRVRRQTGEKRVGHAGTLDPFATGLLIIGVGREATREFPKLIGLDKMYEATFVLGASSDTDDKTGAITPVTFLKPITQEQIETAFKQFIGDIDQIPPAYSAIKIGGKKMYEAARAGKPLEAKPRHVIIYSISHLVIASPEWPKQSPWIASSSGLTTGLLAMTLCVHCSSGTYIRALARDLGKTLGTGCYVETLRRTRIGSYAIEEADPTKIIPIQAFLNRL